MHNFKPGDRVVIITHKYDNYAPASYNHWNYGMRYTIKSIIYENTAIFEELTSRNPFGHMGCEYLQLEAIYDFNKKMEKILNE